MMLLKDLGMKVITALNGSQIADIIKYKGDEIAS